MSIFYEQMYTLGSLRIISKHVHLYSIHISFMHPRRFSINMHIFPMHLRIGTSDGVAVNVPFSFFLHHIFIFAVIHMFKVMFIYTF